MKFNNRQSVPNSFVSLCLGGENRFRFIDHCSLIFKRSADAYGRTLIFTGAGADGLWFTDDDVQSDYGANETIYCGYRFDPESQLYYIRNRTYNPALGRWIQRDPIGISGGINLYEYVGSGPVGNVDSPGLISARPPGPFPTVGLPTIPRDRLAGTFGWDVHQGPTAKSYGPWKTIPGNTNYTLSLATCPPLWQKWVAQMRPVYTTTQFYFTGTRRIDLGLPTDANVGAGFLASRLGLGGLGEASIYAGLALGYVDAINDYEVRSPDPRPAPFRLTELQPTETKWTKVGPPSPMPTP